MRSTAIALVLMVTLAACGTDTQSTADEGAEKGEATERTTGATTNPSDAPSSNQTEATVASELKFTAETIDGDAFDGTTLAGKDTVLWFWAPWCTECRREAPYVAAAQAERSDVTFLGVAGLGSTSDMQDFVDDYDVAAFGHLADLDGSLWQRFGVVQQPAYAFIDADGAVEVVRGELGEDGLAERLDDLTSN